MGSSAALATLAALVLAPGCGDRRARPQGATGADASTALATPADGSASGDASPAATLALDGGGRLDPSTSTSARLVWSLGANRLLLHRSVDGELVADGRGHALSHYTGFGPHPGRWRLAVPVAGQTAAIAGRQAELELPLTADQAGAIVELQARVHVPAARTITIKLDGRKAGPGARAALVPGWQDLRVPVPAGLLRAGDHRVALDGGGGVLALRWLRLAHRAGADAPLPDPLTAAGYDAEHDRFTLRAGAGLHTHVLLPAGAQLVGTVGGGAGCALEVRATTSDGSFAGGLLSADVGRVDLSTVGERAVALSLVARDCGELTLDAAGVELAGPAPAPPALAPPPRYVVLWVMDALRADRVRTFTPGARAETPTFDALAATGVIFRQFYIGGNESQASHSSLWTSLYPARHGVRTAGDHPHPHLSASFATLSTELTAHGLASHAVTGNGFVVDGNGYHRGFASFRNLMREKNHGPNGVLYGAQVVDAALAVLDKARSGPAYLFLGTVDTHGPWIARKPWIDRYSPGRYDGPFQRHGTMAELGIVRGKMGCSKVPPPRDVERLRAIYDSAISYQDAQLGRFVEQLKTWGIWDQTLLVVTADHGEELFEESRCGHGGTLRESLVRVPLLLHYPAGLPGGVAISEGADGVDVLPTVLELLGRPPLEQAQGESLRPIAHGVGRGWVRPSVASQYEYAHALRLGRWKLRANRQGRAALYDVVADPDERVDAAVTSPVERRVLVDHLRLYLATRARWRKARWGVVSNMSAAAAAEIDAP
ncbi:MAG: sulfatase [Kofleriaceae bacterium]|nr:sulfatase [Kofleriaceae bacterium]